MGKSAFSRRVNEKRTTRYLMNHKCRKWYLFSISLSVVGTRRLLCCVLRFIITPIGSFAYGETIVATGSQLGSRNRLRKIKILNEANRNAPDPREDLDTIISHGFPRGSLDPVLVYALLRSVPFPIDIDRQPADQEETADRRRWYQLLHRITAMGDPYNWSERTVGASRFKRDQSERLDRKQIGRSI